MPKIWAKFQRGDP